MRRVREGPPRFCGSGSENYFSKVHKRVLKNLYLFVCFFVEKPLHFLQTCVILYLALREIEC